MFAFLDPLFTPYQVSRRILLAHATAWRLYDTQFRSNQKGIISITLNSDWSEPKDPDSKADQIAAEQYLQVMTKHVAVCTVFHIKNFQSQCACCFDCCVTQASELCCKELRISLILCNCALR